MENKCTSLGMESSPVINGAMLLAIEKLPKKRGFYVKFCKTEGESILSVPLLDAYFPNNFRHAKIRKKLISEYDNF